MPTYHTHNIYLEGEIFDTDTDLQKVELPVPSGVTVTKVTVNSLRLADSNATILVRDQADGYGGAINNITVTVNADAYEGDNTGSLLGTASGLFYVRTGTPGGLYGCNVTLIYERA